MKQLMRKPSIYRYATSKEFAENFKIGEGELGLERDVCYQEKCGADEP